MDSTRRGFLLGAAALSATALGRAAADATNAPGQTTSAQTGTTPTKPPENTFEYRRNWGRWGADDQMGAVNLITPAKRASAAALVKSGRTVSLSRPFQPDQHFIRINDRGAGRSVVDYYGFIYHGVAVTHVDALCHMWDQNGMWNGRDPAREIDTNGARFGGHHRVRQRPDYPRHSARCAPPSSDLTRDARIGRLMLRELEAIAQARARGRRAWRRAAGLQRP